MKDRHPQLALREWRRSLRSPITMVALVGAGLVLGLAGPFGTEALMRTGPRMAYWLVLVGLTYPAGALTSAMTLAMLRARPLWVSALLAGIVTGAVVTAIVLLMNAAAFGWWPDGAEFGPFVGTVMAVSVVITGVFTYIQRHLSRGAAIAPAAPAPAGTPELPPILDRLSFDQRGPLIALSVEDHYVRIRTTRAEALILMRLSDAIREVGQTEGTQVHRSHWVAFDQIGSVRREGDRAILTMTGGHEIPVSRANLPKLKEAGLLPRSAK